LAFGGSSPSPARRSVKWISECFVKLLSQSDMYFASSSKELGFWLVSELGALSSCFPAACHCSRVSANPRLVGRERCSRCCSLKCFLSSAVRSMSPQEVQRLQPSLRCVCKTALQCCS